MEYSCVRIDDLPDEILIYILKKLNNLAILYSLIGVNKRLNKIAHDPNFTSRLTLFQCLPDDLIYSLPDPILDRFCSQILPSINHQIKWLNVESYSMTRIFQAINYPNLCGLGLYGIDVEEAPSLFTDDTVFTHVVKNQISSLVISITENKKRMKTEDVNKIVLTHIFTMFTNLKYLNFDPSSVSYQRLSYDMLPLIVTSNLLELRVSLEHFRDCLYFLDGCFNQLRVFHVNIFLGYTSPTIINDINNREKLPNLKCFSLSCNMATNVYDEFILPLLHRMFNLEELDLYIIVSNTKMFIDGNNLKENIINHMSRLNKFTFFIRSIIYPHNQIDLPSNEDIQHTFRDFKNNQIISYLDYFEEEQRSQCNIYSYSNRLKYYDKITNNFSAGLFKYVRQISLYDERPFEYEFFLRIAKAFPFIKELTILNQKPQKNKLYRKSKNDTQDVSITKYPHLTELNLMDAHQDYVEQFLVDTDMSLSNNVCLVVDYQALKTVTENFTRNTTRINCAKLASLCLIGKYKITKHLKNYFPHTDIL